MGIIKFIKQWTLLFAICVGTIIYLLFSRITFLSPIGDAVGPCLVRLMPFVIFTMLYVTFCKIKLDEFRPRTWHFCLQGIRTLLSAIVVLFISWTTSLETKIILEGVFVCVICPTAAAAPVITEKLGGSVASMTIYMIIANCFTSIIIPLFFPMVEKSANISFLLSFLMVLKRVLMVLVLPLLLALFTRRFLPKIIMWLRSKSNIAFYLWSFNLSIVMGLTVRMITRSQLMGTTMALLIVLPLIISLFLFGIGKFVGGFWG
ncbi:MAG TPA: transporter, partial [Prevotella sp.]|nr:transporter [Prevotella sp.]